MSYENTHDVHISKSLLHLSENGSQTKGFVAVVRPSNKAELSLSWADQQQDSLGLWWRV